jgi:hypothetical protein
MNAKQFLDLYGKGRTREVAEKAGTIYPYFLQIATGKRRPSVELAKKLVEASDHKLDFVSLLSSKTEAA